MARADRNYTWIWLALLAAVATTPLSTSLLAEFITFRLALAIYWFNIVLFGLLLFWSWSYARHASLLSSDATDEVSHAIRRRILVAQLPYAFGALHWSPLSPG